MKYNLTTKNIKIKQLIASLILILELEYLRKHLNLVTQGKKPFPYNSSFMLKEDYELKTLEEIRSKIENEQFFCLENNLNEITHKTLKTLPLEIENIISSVNDNLIKDLFDFH